MPVYLVVLPLRVLKLFQQDTVLVRYFAELAFGLRERLLLALVSAAQESPASVTYVHGAMRCSFLCM